MAAASADATCALIGAVGDDSFGDELLSAVTGPGVDISHVRQVPGRSGVALIVVADDGENTIVVAPGANARLSPVDDGDVTLLCGTAVVVAQLEVPQPTVAAAACATNGRFTSTPLSPPPSRRNWSMRWICWWSINPRPLHCLAPHPITSRSHGCLELVPRVVVTMGAAGSRFAERGGVDVHIVAPDVPVVDSTGAGDAFCGALAAAWSDGKDLVDAVKWSSAAASLAVQRSDAWTAMPTRDDIDVQYTSTYR